MGTGKLWMTALLICTALLPFQVSAQGVFQKLKQTVKQGVQEGTEGPQFYYFCQASYNPHPGKIESVTVDYYSDFFQGSNSQQNAISAAWAAALKPHGVYAADTGSCGPWDQAKAKVLARRDAMIANQKTTPFTKVVVTDWTYKKGFTDTSQLPSEAEAQARIERAKNWTYCWSAGQVNGQRVTYFSELFLAGDEDDAGAWNAVLKQHGWQYPGICQPGLPHGDEGPDAANKAKSATQRDEAIRAAYFGGRGKVYTTDFAGLAAPKKQ